MARHRLYSRNLLRRTAHTIRSSRRTSLLRRRKKLYRLMNSNHPCQNFQTGCCLWTSASRPMHRRNRCHRAHLLHHHPCGLFHCLSRRLHRRLPRSGHTPCLHNSDRCCYCIPIHRTLSPHGWSHRRPPHTACCFHNCNRSRRRSPPDDVPFGEPPLKT